MLQSTAIRFCLLSTVFLLAPLSCVRMVDGSDNQGSVFRGKFVHTDYGFSLAIPEGLTGHPYPADYPFHGLRISDESAKPGWYIVVEAHYYDPDISDPLDYEWKIQKKFIESQGGQALDRSKREHWRELPALRFRFRLKNHNLKGERLTEDGIIIARKELNTLYSISMVTDERQRGAALLVFDQVKNSFTLLPVQ
jgi:hypothetical protein